jgi:hypothetical protein
MNERIAELWNKAAESTKDDSWSSQVTFVEKFAELIGRECLSIADSIRDECDKDGESQQALGAAWVGIAIARHFGIEE